MLVFKGIEFGKGLKMSFPEFKDAFGSNHVFNNIHPDQREEELQKAYKIATDGNTPGTISKIKENPTKESGK
jgi:hypothetical protein